MGNQHGDDHSGHGGGDGEVGDSNHDFGIVLGVVRVTKMVMVTVDVVVVMVRLVIVTMVLVLWWW